MNGLVFGIAQGRTSCGWAVWRRPVPSNPSGEIVALGTWAFDAPETDKDGTLTNQIRREHRLQRRGIRRRAQRMAEVRNLFYKSGLLSSDAPMAVKCLGLNPWELRARGLDQVLAPAELAVALAHIAKRRGFRSIKKGREEYVSGDSQKLLNALEATRRRLGEYRTIGEMFYRDEHFRNRKRNRDGLFDRTQGRNDLIAEVSELFKAQRRLGSEVATVEMESAFASTAFWQREARGSEQQVGLCPFVPTEKRAAKFAPSFERLRIASKLVQLRIALPDGERPLSQDEIARALSDLGASDKLTAKAVRDRIGMPHDQRFVAIKPEDEERDIASRTGGSLYGTKVLRDILGEALWTELQSQVEKLDRVAHIISFFDAAHIIEKELIKLNLPCGAVTALMDDLEAFDRFKGAGHISALAARTLAPHIELGLRYDQACEAVGYNRTAPRWFKGEHVSDKTSFNELVENVGREVAHPVARKSLTEGLKQLWAMRNRWGVPAAIHIEIMRDVGMSLDKTYDINRLSAKGTVERERLRGEVRELLNVSDVTSDTLLHYRLWKEQAGCCPYTGEPIPLTAILEHDSEYQVDYILPWSRFGDDSFSNKVLCKAQSKQEKKGRTPFEWILAEQGEGGWDEFVARIEECSTFRAAKKRNYLLQCSADREVRLRERNLHDIRYVARLFAEAVERFFPYPLEQGGDEIQRVIIRPGALTLPLRYAWGIEALKRGEGNREHDARHPALDALAVSVIGESEVQRLTQSYMEWERNGQACQLRQVDAPWEDAMRFQREAQEAYNHIVVARPERRRARGAGHAATVRQVRERNGAQLVYERKPIADVSEKRLADVKNTERNQTMIQEIRQWIAAGRPVDEPPRSPAGDEIRKVRLLTRGKPAVLVRGGSADRGEIVRIDVFTKANLRGRNQFHLVPIYPHQVMNKRGWPFPPMRAVVAYKDESEWDLMDSSFSFEFSIYPRSFVEVVKPSGDCISGYLCGFDRSTGSINIMPHNSAGQFLKGIGVKRLQSFKKFNVSRFGLRSEVRSEVRTWHGKISPYSMPTD